MGCAPSQQKRDCFVNLKEDVKFSVNRECILKALSANSYIREINIDENEISKLVEAMSAHEYASGTLIYREGSLADELYVMEKGAAIGHSNMISDIVVKSGEVFGDFDFFSYSFHTSTMYTVIK